MPSKSNELDKCVLRALQSDSDRTQKIMAHEAGVSGVEFCRRRRRLKSEGVIKNSTIVVDRARFGFSALGFFTITCSEARFGESVAGMLMKLPEVQEVHALDGPHPLLAKVLARTTGDLSRLQSNILNLEGVKEVRVRVALQTYKETLNIPI